MNRRKTGHALYLAYPLTDLVKYHSLQSKPCSSGIARVGVAVGNNVAFIIELKIGVGCASFAVAGSKIRELLSVPSRVVILSLEIERQWIARVARMVQR